MEILDNFSNRAWQHLVVALLHTIWQGALLSLVLSAALSRLKASRHDARYLMALAAQFGVLLAGLATWSILENEPGRPATTGAASTTSMANGVRPETPLGEARPGSILPQAARLEGVTRFEPGGIRWTSLLAAAWLTGVVVMLTSTGISVWSAARLARGPRVGNPVLLELVERIRDELGIRRRLRVVDAGEGGGPSVLGVLWPTLLLPASALTGLSAEMLRSLLIHELAHLRRNDYLVNLAQMVVESVLFFNPAVWWLGRQARLEREACCDAAAVRLTGRPIDYSRSLAEWAGRGRGLAAGMAWGGDRRPGMLLERIRRVLRPGDRPAARVSPSGLVLLLIGGPALLGILWGGTTAAVGLAAQILSPAERIARIEKAQAEYAPPIVHLDGKGTLKGTIRTADGRPPRVPVWLYHRTDRPGGGGIMGTLEQSRGDFSVEVPAGTTWLSATPDDHAPAVVGPFEVRPGRTIEGIRIVLEAGSPARIAVTDARGAAVPGARMSAHLIIGGKGSIGTTNGLTTDRSGEVTIPHALERPYHISVSAPGYEPLESVTLTPSFTRTETLTLKKTRPARGVAVDVLGRPVAGTEVRIYREEQDEGSARENHISGPLVATTDTEGRFTLDTLKDRTSYILFVTSKAGGRGISPRIRAGQDGIRVTVSPKWSIQGTIRSGGDKKGNTPVPTTIGVEQRFRVPGGREPIYTVRWSIPVDPAGRFSIADLMPCETVLEAAGRTVRVMPDRPETPVTIDLSRPAEETRTRRVVLQVATPDGAIPPSGTIDVYSSVAVDRAPTPPRELSLQSGRAAFDATVSSLVTYQLREMVGYWFKDGSNIAVRPGEGEQVIEIPAVPAGAIVGQVLDADGKPAGSGISINCRTVEAAPGLKDEVFIKGNVRVDAQGRFFASPLPLGGSYVAIAGRGHNRQVGPTVRLDGANPTVQVTIRMARDSVARGRVVGPDGSPLAGVPVKLELVHPTAGQGWLPAARTDDDGGFVFDDVSAELDGYRAIVEPADLYQPAQGVLRPGGLPVEIRLGRGHVIEGRVVDAETGRPIPGVAIYARRAEWDPAQQNFFDARGKTDDQGRFRFGNLGTGAWMLNDRDGLEWVSPHKSHAFGVDGPEPVVIRAIRPGGRER